MGTPGATDGGDASDGKDPVHRTKHARSLEFPKTTHFSALSLWEPCCTVAACKRVNEDNNNREKSRDLKDCWKAVVANDSSLSQGDAVGEGGPDGEGDDADISGDQSDDIDAEEERRGNPENLAPIHNAFKDPFPIRTPESGKISLSYRRNKLNMETIAAQHATKAEQRNSSDPTIIATSPYSLYAPQTPPISRPSTPQPQPSPIKPIIRNNNDSSQKSWIDPFPTPDVSVSSRFNTPLSSKIKANSGDLDGDKYEKQLNSDWETMLQSIPNIPPIEELGTGADHHERTRSNSIVAESYFRLQLMGASDLSTRKVSSENDLPLIEQPVLEDILEDLRSGPNGIEMVNDYDLNLEKRMIKEKSKTENVMIWREALDHHHNGRDSKPLRLRQSTKQKSEISLTAAVETASWESLYDPLVTYLDVGESRRSKKAMRNKTKNFKITNLTGADLATDVKAILNKGHGIPPPKGPLTPNRLHFSAWDALKSSKAVANAKTAAGELVFSPVRTVGNVYRKNSQRAHKLVRNTRQRLKERKELRRQRRLARTKSPPRSWWIIIQADNPYKIAWDILTMSWALLGAYRTHVRIRDRVFDQSPLIILTEIWFTIDILLNFVTEHKTRKGEVIRDGKAVWARYLTTWFVIDILSLIPWERIYVRPVVEKIKKRNFFQKTFFRSKAVVCVSRVLRGRHIKLFGRVSKQTGTPLSRLVALVIKYVPKYLVFLRNMKGALVLRALRFIHWLHNMYKKFWVKAKHARENYMARRIARRLDRQPSRYGLVHDFFGLAHNDDGTDSESDHDDEDDYVDDDGLEGDDESEYSVPTPSFHRKLSEGITRRHRSHSHHELYATLGANM